MHYQYKLTKTKFELKELFKFF